MYVTSACSPRSLAMSIHSRSRSSRRSSCCRHKPPNQQVAAKRERRRLAPAGGLPEYAVLVITGIGAGGEVLARPQVWKPESAPPAIFMAPDRHGTPALDEGERVLARLARQPDGTYSGRVV